MSNLFENPEAEMLFGDIIEYIESAQKKLAADAIESLGELDLIADELAARVAALPANVIENYQPEMEYVTEQLRDLTASMMEKRLGMAHDLDIVEKRLKAIRAYHATPSEGE